MKEVDENYEAYMADGGAENLAKQREEEAAEKKLTLKEQIVRAMVQVNCETCYLHKPGTYTRKDCITYGKRLCALEEVHVDKILALGLVQLDEDQDVPGFISNPEDWTVEDAEYETTRRLREAGWRKVRKIV